MDSLLCEVPSMMRSRQFEEARAILQVFLVSIFATLTVLLQRYQTLENERDALIASEQSGNKNEDFDVRKNSFASAIQIAKEEQELHQAEFRSCGPQLGHAITTITGQHYTDTVDRFKADFATAVHGMAHRFEELQSIEIPGFCATYATVRGDGSCLFRAFLTVLAFQLVGVVLPNDPEGMMEWIIRLKLLMCSHIQEIVRNNSHFAGELLSIPRNGTVCNLQDYFAKFICHGYHGTDYDCKILAGMFGKPIHVIQDKPGSVETHQTFPAGPGQELRAIELTDMFIVHQSGCHYVPVVHVVSCWLEPAVAPKYE